MATPATPVPPATQHPAASYAEAVGSDAPVPGGGSVAATVGALAAALAEMVSRFSAGRSDDPEVNASIDAIRANMESARVTLLNLALQDEAAFATYRRAAELPKSTPEEKATRSAALQTALVGAADIPMRTAQACHSLKSSIDVLRAQGNPHVRSDGDIASILLDAALRASAINVRVNTAMLKDRDVAADLERKIGLLLD